MGTKRYFIHTFGCQMNVNDTNRMGEALASMSYAPTPVAENADLIDGLVVACSAQVSRSVSGDHEEWSPRFASLMNRGSEFSGRRAGSAGYNCRKTARLCNSQGEEPG